MHGSSEVAHIAHVEADLAPMPRLSDSGFGGRNAQNYSHLAVDNLERHESFDPELVSRSMLGSVITRPQNRELLDPSMMDQAYELFHAVDQYPDEMDAASHTKDAQFGQPSTAAMIDQIGASVNLLDIGHLANNLRNEDLLVPDVIERVRIMTFDQLQDITRGLSELADS